MNTKLLSCLFLLFQSYLGFAQGRSIPDQNTAVTNSKGAADGKSTSQNAHYYNDFGTVRQGDGYIVYRHDTLKGEIFLSKKDVTVEKRIDSKHNFVATYKLNNINLKTIMMYNLDKKPLCITRIRKNDKKMMRVVHEGKLNIYDDRIDYIYEPGDIDKNLIVISYGDVIEDLSSFLTENTKRDLIIFVNDIYGLNIEPRSISWKELLVKVDMLD